jgi:hypothetical protein
MDELIHFDHLEGPGNPSIQFPTRCVHNLAIDWLDENYIASCTTSNESTISVWDRRVGTRLASPTVGSSTSSPDSNQTVSSLQFKNVFNPKASIWSLRFSKTNRGCLGALSNSGHFKTFDIAKDHLSEEFRSSIDETLGQGSFKNYPEPVYTKYVRDVCMPFDHPTRGTEEKDRIVSFDFLNFSFSSQASAIALDGKGNPQIVTSRPPCPPIAVSSQSVLACGAPTGDGADFRTIHPLSGTEPVPSREKREWELSLGTQGTLLTANEALTLSSLNQYRAKEGYLFDEARNQKIWADDSALQDLWAWVKRK